MRALSTLGLFITVFTVGALTASAQGERFGKLPVVSSNQKNSQTMTLLEGHLNVNPVIASAGQLAVVDGSALMPETLDGGTTSADAGFGGSSQISIYVVRQGDTLSTIAQMFNVSVNTIAWANDIKGGKITPGQELVILPISGVRHTVAKGDTVQTIAKKYGADLSEVLAYNGITASAKLDVGDIVIVPDGELATSSAGSSSGSGTPSYAGYYMRPVTGGRKSQGIHGHNGIDIAAPVGTPILASANGTVIVARSGGWNGGYGSYVVISHPNGTQTLYAHLSAVNTSVGAKVTQGQVIGAMGNTGKSTGPHLHFEIRGAKNPF